MKISIFQSNYLPWKGYFDLIDCVDIFYFLDNVEYSINTFRNRNKIKSKNSTFYLTVPLQQNSSKENISEKKIANNDWQNKHWKSITQTYSKSKNFKVISNILKTFYVKDKFTNLSDLNQNLIIVICQFLKIKTKLIHHDEINLVNSDKNQRLIEIIKKLKCDTYVSSPLAKNYLDEEMFLKEGIKVEWYKYSETLNNLSIIDYLFNSYDI